MAQTDCFETAFDDTAKRRDGFPATHVAIYGMGLPDHPWMAFRVPPYVVERLRRPGVRPKTILLDQTEIYVTYEEDVPDREPVAWAGVDMNADNNVYACADGTVIIRRNDHARQYNAACCKVSRVKRRGDRRVIAKYQAKAWGTYRNHIRNDVHPEARETASAG